MRLLDFSLDPEAARVTINDWVEDQTEERIKDLLPLNSITSATRLVLTNCIYFKAAWGIPFDEDLTADGDFNLENGSTVSVPFMTLEHAMGEQGEAITTASGDGYRAVDLPYFGGQFSMLIVMPDAGNFSQVEQSLNADVLAGIVQSLEPSQVSVTMPKFEYTSEFSLKDQLVQLGIVDAFGGAADFSGIDGVGGLFISNVFHKSFIAVDEKGTEAAAATAVVFFESAAPPETHITLNRPFIYFIRDVESGTILFAGCLMNPASS